MTDATVVEDAAAAAYSSYWRSRKGAVDKPWGRLVPHEQDRWLRIAAAFLNNPAMDARALREAYFTGYAEWSWENVTPAVVTRWSHVVASLRMVAVRQQVAA